MGLIEDRSWGKGTYRVIKNGRRIEGFGDTYKPVNPHNFEPDTRWATSVEINNYHTACKKYDLENKRKGNNNE